MRVSVFRVAGGRNIILDDISVFRSIRGGWAATLEQVFDLTELQEYSRKAAGLDPALACAADVLAGANAIAAAEGALAAAKGHLLANLEARGTTVTETGLSTATWLSRETGVSAATARTQVKVANKLVTLALVDEALIEGRISFDYARVIVEAAEPACRFPDHGFAG